MERSFACPLCGADLAADDVATGDGIACPECGDTFELPPGANLATLNAALSDRGRAFHTFEHDKELARGGMGTVLRCNDVALHRQVAMKVMSPQLAAAQRDRLRFVEEAQLTGQLEHPNIVPIHDVGQDPDGNLFFTMKLVKGRSLAEILAENVTPLPELLTIFLKACDGIAFAHSKQVIHRDLKPANIMIGDFGEVLVMDWGVAKHLGRDEPDGRVDVTSLRADIAADLTMQGDITGTPAYMVPEQALGHGDKFDARTDIYALGAILYEILTRLRPVEGKNVQKVLMNVSRGRVTPPAERTPDRAIAPEVAAVAMKALSRQREDRYQSVPELSADIRLFLDGRAVSAKTDSPMTAMVKLLKRNRGASAIGGVALIVIVVLTLTFVLRVTAERDRAESALAAAQQAESSRLAAELRSSRDTAEEAIRAMDTGFFREARIRAESIGAGHSPWGPYARGYVAWKSSDTERAAAEFAAALERDPNHAQSQTALASMQAEQGNLSRARELAENLDQLKDWRSAVAAGDTLYKARDWTHASEAY